MPRDDADGARHGSQGPVDRQLAPVSSTGQALWAVCADPAGRSCQAVASSTLALAKGSNLRHRSAGVVVDGSDRAVPGGPSLPKFVLRAQAA